VRMSTLSLSFILVFLQSLALDYELPVSYTFMKHVIFYFIIVGIILFITKLLLFLTF
jgi:vacuolar-type H+-ATPase subunit I/STV1